ncbi:hypothetical protein [Roseibium alexandrii]|jgi:hypothetical protein|uniref:Uncharacterized protein n=1 Tax=Roseibium alexandrii TaxID=388408 RepID=A0A0M7AJ66_9HYPH|nr:hypothetical protein [Roseibium alexandrii]CTQ74280.1 hypothetical protein LAX5112_03822 [Roseibium alexandrii]
MAHSLFEPDPMPFHEKLMRRMRDLSGHAPAQIPKMSARLAAADPGLVRQAKRLDARGQQLLLEVVFDAETPAK